MSNNVETESASRTGSCCRDASLPTLFVPAAARGNFLSTLGSITGAVNQRVRATTLQAIEVRTPEQPARLRCAARCITRPSTRRRALDALIAPADLFIYFHLRRAINKSRSDKSARTHKHVCAITQHLNNKN